MRVFVPSKGLLAALLLLLAAGCNFPGAAPSASPAPGGSATPAVAQPAATPTPAGPALLPHALYFFSEHSGNQQVWRLERDGVSQQQVTREVGEVLAFDVSRVDGSVAFIVDNQLYIVDADGNNRRLMVDNGAADAQAADYFFTQRISDPLFSPDGRYLAFAFNGLWIVDLSTNQAINLLENQTDEDGEIYYAPLAWAPNSQQMLLSLGGAEASTLAFMDPGAEQLVIEVENGAGLVCCQAAWVLDSSSVLVASPYLGLIEPGLWRYDARTGAASRLLESQADGLFQFAGWPLQLADGSLQYFFASAAEVPEGDAPLYMVHSAADGVGGRIQLRGDAFSNIGEVLWAEDGSLALVVQRRPDGVAGGSVLAAFSDGRQLQLLLDAAHQLHWGP